MIEGSCLCGAVRFRVAGKPFWAHQCHCSRCRKASGSAFTTPLIVEKGSIEFTQGRDEVTVYRHPGSEYATSFCRVCGSATPLTEPSDTQPVEAVPTGALDTDPGLKPVAHIYVGSMAAWDSIADDLPQFEEMPSPEVQADLLTKALSR